MIDKQVASIVASRKNVKDAEVMITSVIADSVYVVNRCFINQSKIAEVYRLKLNFS